jgi:hypothetical protein
MSWEMMCTAASGTHRTHAYVAMHMHTYMKCSIAQHQDARQAQSHTRVGQLCLTTIVKLCT